LALQIAGLMGEGGDQILSVIVVLSTRRFYVEVCEEPIPPWHLPWTTCNPSCFPQSPR